MIDSGKSKPYRIALHHLGFRPFFLLGCLFAIGSMFLWWWMHHFGTNLFNNNRFAPLPWHAHEMIYGYAMAVIAGFLLTAVQNWTSVQTLRGPPLILLAALWLGARILPFFPYTQATAIMALLDLSFNFVLFVAVVHPVVKVRQWRQLGIVLLLLLFIVGNGLFYLGVHTKLANGVQYGLYTGLYMVVFLIMVMGRRVIPFFIEKGVDGDVKLRNRKWVDISSVVVMCFFIMTDVYLRQPVAAAISAVVLFVLLSIRIYDWNTAGLWGKPLLWSIFIAYAWIALGFAMRAISLVAPLDSNLAIHAFAYGGIGLMTLSMMSRVILAHTGRNIHQPPGALKWFLLIFIAGAVVRALIPIILPGYYNLWIEISQLLWMVVFSWFCFLYIPMLVKPRVDGRYG